MRSSLDADDYVLGTHDDEILRLGTQHRVWRSRVLDAWRRAGIGTGQTVVDVGAGPGFATFELAEVVGPTGRVVAVERASRFLDVLRRERDRRGLAQIELRRADLHDDQPTVAGADAVWCRWILAFLTDPQRLVRRLAEDLKPGGAFVAHEYLSYSSWRLLPRSSEFEAFVAAVIDTWRVADGEPDIGCELPAWLEANGLEIRHLQPQVFIASVGDPFWIWLEAFVRTGLARLVSLGQLTQSRAEAMLEDFERRREQPGTRVMTPTVLEVIAAKR
jgi:SAM-dependent methyltransferase